MQTQKSGSFINDYRQDQEDTEEKWHYIALKSELSGNGHKKPTQSLSKLYRGITSNHNGDFHCLRCLHSYRTDKILKDHARICNNHKCCQIVMPAKGKNILRYNSGEKSLKAAHIFYLDIESLLIKKQSCQNNPGDLHTEIKAIHEACGYSLKSLTSHDSTQDKHSYYRGTDYIKKLCKDIKEQAIEIINIEKKYH